MLLKPNASFGAYKVVKLLGQGSMGPVYLLEEPTYKTLRAVKFIEATVDNAVKREYLSVARALSTGELQGLLRVYEVGLDGRTGLDYILMEYLPGGAIGNQIRSLKRQRTHREQYIAVEDLKPQNLPAPHRKKRSKPDGDVKRTFKLLVILAVSALAVSVIAVIAYGFFFEKRSVVERTQDLELVPKPMRPLAEVGTCVRSNMQEVVRKIVPVNQESPQTTAGSAPATNKVTFGRFFPGLTNLVKKLPEKRQEKEIEAASSCTAPHSATNAPSPQNKTPSAKSHTKTNAVPEKRKWVVDPKLKKFKGGGKCRRLGS